jgi:hypothetical protein
VDWWWGAVGSSAPPPLVAPPPPRTHVLGRSPSPMLPAGRQGATPGAHRPLQWPRRPTSAQGAEAHGCPRVRLQQPVVNASCPAAGMLGTVDDPALPPLDACSCNAGQLRLSAPALLALSPPCSNGRAACYVRCHHGLCVPQVPRTASPQVPNHAELAHAGICHAGCVTWGTSLLCPALLCCCTIFAPCCQRRSGVGHWAANICSASQLQQQFSQIDRQQQAVFAAPTMAPHASAADGSKRLGHLACMACPAAPQAWRNLIPFWPTPTLVALAALPCQMRTTPRLPPAAAQRL